MADKLVRPLNAPPGIQAAPGVQPGVDSPVVLARRVIIFGPNDGLFVYNGAPRPGNGPIAWISNSLTDPYGNALIAQGIVSFESPTYTQLFGGQLVIGNTSAGAIADFLVNDSGVLVLQGTAGVTSLAVAMPISQPLYASNPSAFGTAETWHTAVLGNGWTGTAQYQLQPDNTVAIRSLSSLGAGTLTNGTVLFTLPAAYQPSLAQVIPCLISAVGGGSAATGDSPYLQVGTDGTVEVFNVAVQVATNVRIPMSLFSLT